MPSAENTARGRKSVRTAAVMSAPSVPAPESSIAAMSADSAMAIAGIGAAAVAAIPRMVIDSSASMPPP